MYGSCHLAKSTGARVLASSYDRYILECLLVGVLLQALDMSKSGVFPSARAVSPRELPIRVGATVKANPARGTFMTCDGCGGLGRLGLGMNQWAAISDTPLASTLVLIQLPLFATERLLWQRRTASSADFHGVTASLPKRKRRVPSRSPLLFFSPDFFRFFIFGPFCSE